MVRAELGVVGVVLGDSLCRDCPGRPAKAEVGVSCWGGHRVFNIGGCSGVVTGTKVDVGQDVPGHLHRGHPVGCLEMRWGSGCGFLGHSI